MIDNEKIQKIKQLRLQTSMSLIECQNALKEANYDISLAFIILKEKIKKIAEKKNDRKTKTGTFGVYLHNNGTILGIVELLSETDFVSKNSKFKDLAKDLATQIIFSNDVKYISEDDINEEDRKNVLEKDLDQLILLKQPFFKNNSITIQDLLNENCAKFGENIKISNFYRFII